MIRPLVLSATLAFGFATAASAAVIPAPTASPDSVIIKVAEGCGPDGGAVRTDVATRSQWAASARPAITSVRTAGAAGRTDRAVCK